MASDAVPSKVKRNQLNTLALQLFDATSNGVPSTNHCISPISISLVLSILRDSACPTVEKELGALLQNVDARHMDEILFKIERSKRDETTCIVANSFCANQEKKGDFFDYLQSAYRCETNAPLLLEAITAWISEKTQGFIKSIDIPRELFTEDGACLINTIYFDARWMSHFQVVRRKFDVSRDHYLESHTFLTAKEQLPYVETKTGWQCVDVPLKSGFAITFMLGRDSSQKPSASDVEETIANQSKSLIDLYIPIFKMETRTISLKDSLRGLGVNETFEQNGEFHFPKVDQRYIADAFHKVIIDVSREGVKAAGATVMMMARFGCMPPTEKPKLVELNRPFYFFVHHGDVMLFMGHCVNPAR